MIRILLLYLSYLSWKQEVLHHEASTVRLLFSQIRCCKVRVRSMRKQENGIYRLLYQNTYKQMFKNTHSLQVEKYREIKRKQEKRRFSDGLYKSTR